MIWEQGNRDRLEAMLRESRETGRPIQLVNAGIWKDIQEGVNISLKYPLSSYRVKPAHEDGTEVRAEPAPTCPPEEPARSLGQIAFEELFDALTKSGLMIIPISWRTLPPSIQACWEVAAQTIRVETSREIAEQLRKLRIDIDNLTSNIRINRSVD